MEVVRFDPKTTTPPMTAAIAPITATALSQIAPSRYVDKKTIPAAMATFESKIAFRHPSKVMAWSSISFRCARFDRAARHWAFAYSPNSCNAYIDVSVPPGARMLQIPNYRHTRDARSLRQLWVGVSAHRFGSKNACDQRSSGPECPPMGRDKPKQPCKCGSPIRSPCRSEPALIPES